MADFFKRLLGSLSGSGDEEQQQQQPQSDENDNGTLAGNIFGGSQDMNQNNNGTTAGDIFGSGSDDNNGTVAGSIFGGGQADENQQDQNGNLAGNLFGGESPAENQPDQTSSLIGSLLGGLCGGNCENEGTAAGNLFGGNSPDGNQTNSGTVAGDIFGSSSADSQPSQSVSTDDMMAQIFSRFAGGQQTGSAEGNSVVGQMLKGLFSGGGSGVGGLAALMTQLGSSGLGAKLKQMVLTEVLKTEREMPNASGKEKRDHVVKVIDDSIKLPGIAEALDGPIIGMFVDAICKKMNLLTDHHMETINPSDSGAMSGALAALGAQDSQIQQARAGSSSLGGALSMLTKLFRR